MIVCHRCGKENQNHYKFCLGCGADLTSAPKGPAKSGNVGMLKTMLAEPDHGVEEATRPGGLPGSPLSPPPTGRRPAGPPPGVPAASEVTPPGTVGAPLAGGNTAASPWSPPHASGLPGVPQNAGSGASEARTCPACQATVPPAFKFCGVCGFKLDDAPAPQPAVVVSSPTPEVTRALMTLIRPDGSEGGSHELQVGENKIGRIHGTIFENDGYLSPTHALLLLDVNNKTALIRDLGSLNGVFVKMIGEEDIQSGQIVRIGQELLRFDTIALPEPLEDGTEVMGSPNPGYWGKLTVVIGRGIDGSAYPLLGESVTLGRERGEINFPDDGYVSGLHARLSNQNGRVVLADLGSSNGTFIKVQGERAIYHDSFILLGQQLFRLTLPI